MASQNPPGQPKRRKKRKKQRDVLKERLPRVTTFFREAHVPIRLEREWVTIAGERAFRAPPRGATLINWDDVIDRVVLAHCPDRMVRELLKHGHFVGAGVRAYFDRSRHAFVLRRDETTLAYVMPTRAFVPGQGYSSGNFLTGGSHWSELAQAIRRREARLRERPKSDRAPQSAVPLIQTMKWHFMTEPPDGLDPPTLELCLEASENIRMRRSIAYPRAVVLQTSNSSLRLHPITRMNGALVAPFAFEIANGENVDGRIILDAIRDPIPVAVTAEVTAAVQRYAWTAALLGFAAATCFVVDGNPARQERLPRPGREIRREGNRSTGRSSSTGLPRRRFWPSALQPSGRWARRTAVFVPGHRRRLYGDRRPSEEARARAREVGIHLAPNETWVRPHARGLGAHEELTFDWAAPPELALARPSWREK